MEIHKSYVVYCPQNQKYYNENGYDKYGWNPVWGECEDATKYESEESAVEYAPKWVEFTVVRVYHKTDFN